MTMCVSCIIIVYCSLVATSLLVSLVYTIGMTDLIQSPLTVMSAVRAYMAWPGMDYLVKVLCMCVCVYTHMCIHMCVLCLHETLRKVCPFLQVACTHCENLTAQSKTKHALRSIPHQTLYVLILAIMDLQVVGYLLSCTMFIHV